MTKVNKTIPFFLSLSFLFSCGENKTVTISNTMQDEAKFAAALDGSEYSKTSELEGTEDGKESGLAPSFEGAAEYIPSRPDYGWWRSGLSRSRNISNIEYSADSSSASLRVNNSITGVLNMWKFLQGTEAKNWTMSGYRKAKFNKQTDGTWRLRGISPLVLKSPANTIEIERVEITQGTEKKIQITNPYNITTLADVPVISRNEQIKVEVTLNVSSGTAFLFSHTGFMRQIMADDGASSPFYGDAVAGDKTFTRMYYIGGTVGAGTTGIRRIVLDAVSRDTLNDRTNGVYDCCIWVIPYMVQ